MNIARFGLLALLSTSLAACVTAPSNGPVEITRFHQSAAIAQLGSGTVFVDGIVGEDAEALEIAPYKAAVAAELVRLGYRETSRSEASHIAQVRVAKSISEPQRRRSPVSVGMGGSTGSYGSGVGLGIGINLGGGKKEMLGTNLAVNIRDSASNEALWEARADFTVSYNSSFADSGTNAAAIAEAMFREFPGNNGETVEVRP
jgi:hypothetical protein